MPVAGPITLALMVGKALVQSASLVFGDGPQFKTVSPGQFPRKFAVNQLLSSTSAYGGSVADKLLLSLTFFICNIGIISCYPHGLGVSSNGLHIVCIKE